MVGGHTAQQGLGMDAIAHRFWGGLGKRLERQAQFTGFLLIHQAGLEQIAHGLIAAAAAEQKDDGRHHLSLDQLGHHEAHRGRLWLGRLGVFAAAVMPFGRAPHLAVGMQTGALVIKQRMQPFGAAKTELQRHRPEVADDQIGRAVDLFNPVGELPSIGHGGGETHQLNCRRAVNDRFLPHGAPLGIIHVVALIEHHGFHPFQGILTVFDLRIKHVAEDLGGHHHDRGFAVGGEIPRHQAHAIGAELLAEIPQFLVRQRLQRGGVKNTLAMGQGAMDGVLANQGFARSGGGTYHHRMPLVQGSDGLQLEVIKGERKQRRRIQSAVRAQSDSTILGVCSGGIHG